MVPGGTGVYRSVRQTRHEQARPESGPNKRRAEADVRTHAISQTGRARGTPANRTRRQEPRRDVKITPPVASPGADGSVDETTSLSLKKQRTEPATADGSEWNLHQRRRNTRPDPDWRLQAEAPGVDDSALPPPRIRSHVPSGHSTVIPAPQWLCPREQVQLHRLRRCSTWVRPATPHGPGALRRLPRSPEVPECPACEAALAQ